jgi:hypothetical protein
MFPDTANLRRGKLAGAAAANKVKATPIPRQFLLLVPFAFCVGSPIICPMNRLYQRADANQSYDG